MNLDRSPNPFPTWFAYDTAAGWFSHRSVSSSSEAADRPVTDPDSLSLDGAEVSSRPPDGRSAVHDGIGPLTVPDRRVGTVRRLVRSARRVGGSVVRASWSGEVVRHDTGTTR